MRRLRRCLLFTRRRSCPILPPTAGWEGEAYGVSDNVATSGALLLQTKRSEIVTPADTPLPGADLQPIDIMMAATLDAIPFFAEIGRI